MFFVINAFSFAISDASYLNIGLAVFLSNLTFLTMSCTINSASSNFKFLPFDLALFINISATSLSTSFEGPCSNIGLTLGSAKILYSVVKLFFILSFIKLINSLVLTFKFLPFTTVFKN